MKYPQTFAEYGLPDDVHQEPYDTNLAPLLIGTVTYACGHRELAFVAKKLSPEDQALGFEASRHFYCLSCYSQWHAEYHRFVGDPYRLDCAHNLNPRQFWGMFERDLVRARAICSTFEYQPMYPEIRKEVAQ